MTMSQLSVLKLYNAVVDDVIAGVRDCFLDDGVDEQVLQELKQLWKTKLQASGAMDPPVPELTLAPPPVLQNFHNSKNNIVPKVSQSTSQQNPSAEHGTSSNIAGAHPHHVLDPNNKVPVQLTLPAQPGVPGSQPRSFTIQIPASALNGNKLHQVLTGPIINATISLPQPLAATLLQQHINSALAGQQQNEFDGGGGGGGRSGGAPLPWSLDGALDSSDEEGSNAGEGSDEAEAGAEDEEEEESGEDRADDEEEERDDSAGADDEPLNSSDDVSDEEPGDMFDTDNVVVCQYDKITRSRNKWKFYLKDGIMNLAGKDFVFQKANGDAEW